jgi:hypothetical protein
VILSLAAPFVEDLHPPFRNRGFSAESIWGP